MEAKTLLHGANFGDAMNVFFAVKDFKDAKAQGDNNAIAAAKAAGSFAWGEFYYGGVGAMTSGALSKVGGKIAGTAIGGKIAGTIGGKIAGAAIGFTAPLIISSIPAMAQLAGAAMEHTTTEMTKAYASRGRLGSGHFEMTNAGYTMRQRSLNAIRQNGLNTQSAIGNEARTYYRSTL